MVSSPKTYPQSSKELVTRQDSGGLFVTPAYQMKEELFPVLKFAR